MTDDPRFVWVTKYCLGDGMIEKRRVVSVSENRYVSITGGWMTFKLDRDCFLDKTGAHMRAVEMRNKKLAALRKQIAKLEALEFRTEDETCE